MSIIADENKMFINPSFSQYYTRLNDIIGIYNFCQLLFNTDD
jgi:hypothetical protein